ncbi:hypothetical protein TCDM_07877 [Trypanosoma cruzi Dm28c]|uniref:Uncharacterized protein n=1 Tax=Trypanosoma cruzi Dm28c TaxID=1416333 RepID=V5D9K4_TRYCR|nr:hypothetical protein TCDM_07877 [Trypanosoma cruzi Dm28c]
MGARKKSQNIIKKGKIDSKRRLSYAPRSIIQSCVCVCILPATRKKIKEKSLLFHKPTQHSSHFVQHPACPSNHRFVQSVGRKAAGPAPNLGKKKQTIKGNTSLMTVCSRQPLSKEDSKNAQWSVGNTSGTALSHPSPYGGSTHPSTKRKTRRQGVAVCVALRVSARPDRKENKTRGKKCVLRPTGPRRTPTRHGFLSAPFVAAPPHACSRRGAQGRRHERVGGCASGAVGRQHTAPLAGKAIKKGTPIKYFKEKNHTTGKNQKNI